MRTQACQTVAIAASSSGNNEIVAAQTGKVIRVLGYVLSSSGTVNAKWRTANTDKTGLIYMVANNQVQVALPSQPDDFWFETVAGEALNLNLSGAVAVGGHLSYIVY